MEHVVLGRTGVSVSRIGAGTWSHGGANVSDGVPVGWSGQEDSDSEAALLRAYELGINHWDTADVYGDGRAERIIGGLWDRVPRGEIFLATKVGWDRGPHAHYYHPAHMRRQLEQSLANLKTDALDLYYFHHCLFGRSGEYFDDAMAEMLRFREEGKFQFLGLSDWDMDKIVSYADRVNPDVIQPYRNVMDDSYASSGLKEWVEARSAGVIFFSPLKQGLLTGKYSAPPFFHEGDFRANVPEFSDGAIIVRMAENRRELERTFAAHPEPVLHGLVDALLADAPTGGALVGTRNRRQAEAAATLGTALDTRTAARMFSLYRR